MALALALDLDRLLQLRLDLDRLLIQVLDRSKVRDLDRIPGRDLDRILDKGSDLLHLGTSPALARLQMPPLEQNLPQVLGEKPLQDSAVAVTLDSGVSSPVGSVRKETQAADSAKEPVLSTPEKVIAEEDLEDLGIRLHPEALLGRRQKQKDLELVKALGNHSNSRLRERLEHRHLQGIPRALASAMAM